MEMRATTAPPGGHDVGSIEQRVQPSPGVWLPSSHSSPASRTPLPQSAMVEDDVLVDVAVDVLLDEELPIVVEDDVLVELDVVRLLLVAEVDDVDEVEDVDVLGGRVLVVVLVAVAPEHLQSAEHSPPGQPSPASHSSFPGSNTPSPHDSRASIKRRWGVECWRRTTTRPRSTSHAGPTILASRYTWRAFPQFFHTAMMRVKLRLTPVFLVFSADAGQPLTIEKSSTTIASCVPVTTGPGRSGGSTTNRPATRQRASLVCARTGANGPAASMRRTNTCVPRPIPLTIAPLYAGSRAPLALGSSVRPVARRSIRWMAALLLAVPATIKNESLQ